MKYFPLSELKTIPILFRRWFSLIAFMGIFQCAGVYDIEPHVPVHSITGVTPLCGNTGDTIIIRGTKFSSISSENVVTINGSRAVVNVAAPTYLNVIVPAQPGSGNVRVAIDNAYVDGDEFTYFPTGVVSIVEPDMSGIAGIAADVSGNFIIVRNGMNRIDFRTPAGETTLFAGGGRIGTQAGFFNSVGRFALFNNPSDVVIDSYGNIYVSDTDNHCIRQITPEGIVTLYAGVHSPQFHSPQPGLKDGLRTEAFFSFPGGLAIDKEDNLYVCDVGNVVIRKIEPDNGNTIGKVTTIAGTGAFGGQDGPVGQATFSILHDLVVDDEKNIFVSEENEDPKIRMISNTGIVSTIMLGPENVYNGCKGEPYVLGGAYGLAIGPEGNLYCGVYAGTSQTYYTFTPKIITITRDRKIGILAGGGSPNGPFEGIGDKVYIPFAGKMALVGNALYVGANYQLLRIDLN